MRKSGKYSIVFVVFVVLYALLPYSTLSGWDVIHRSVAVAQTGEKLREATFSFFDAVEFGPGEIVVSEPVDWYEAKQADFFFELWGDGYVELQASPDGELWVSSYQYTEELQDGYSAWAYVEPVGEYVRIYATSYGVTSTITSKVTLR